MMVEIIEFIKDMFKYIIIIGLIILLRIYVITTAEVVGPSMKPTLTDGNMLMVEQLTARFKKIDRFDIIVFKYDSPRYLIKRVIGLPGETVKYEDNKLYVDGKQIDEEFKTKGDVENFEATVTENMYFVIGDNRDDSVDSRAFGLVSEDDIIGQPFLTIWPFNNFGVINW